MVTFDKTEGIHFLFKVSVDIRYNNISVFTLTGAGIVSLLFHDAYRKTKLALTSVIMAICFQHIELVGLQTAG